MVRSPLFLVISSFLLQLMYVVHAIDCVVNDSGFSVVDLCYLLIIESLKPSERLGDNRRFH